MQRSSRRRAVRATIVTGLVFILLGTGAGFASTGTDTTELILPRPGPGAQAEYAMRPMALLPGVEVPEGPTRISLEWLPLRVVVDDAWRQVVAMPLAITHHYTEHRIEMIAFYDAATGEPIADGWRRGNDYAPGTLAGLTTSASEHRSDLAYTMYEGLRGPCGMLTPLHGGVLRPGPVLLPGHCTYYDSALLWNGTVWTPFQAVQHGDDALLLRSQNDPGIEVVLQEGEPFPMSIVAPLTNVGTGPGVAWQWTRTAYTAAPTPYPSLHDSVQDVGPGAISLAPRTPWNLHDDDMDHPFPLRAAYQAALADTATPRVQDFLESHPEAYLGQAWSNRQVDGAGNSHYYWWMTWTDGHDTLSKRVVERPTGILGITVDAVREVQVSNHRYQDIDEGRRHFPDPSALPEHLPLASDVMARYRLVEDPDRLPDDPNRYGMGYYCDTPACMEPATLVAAGYFVMDLPSDGTELRVMLDGRRNEYSQVMVRDEGIPMYTETFEYRQPALLSIPAAGEDASSDEAATNSPVWVPPAAQVTAGMGILALIAGALYYFWPTLKALPTLGLFSRIRRHEVLENPNRAAIHAIIQAEPGVHFQEIRRRSGVGRGALEHHLHKLSAAGLIIAQVGPGYTCYFPRGALDRRIMAAQPYLKSAGSRRVLEALVNDGPCSTRLLAQRAKLAPATASHHLGRLREVGLVEGGGRQGYRVTELGEQALAP